jgi:hypothetical protein
MSGLTLHVVALVRIHQHSRSRFAAEGDLCSNRRSPTNLASEF